MIVNTTVFCFERDHKLVKTDARLSTNIKEDIVPKLHNKMNRHIKATAVTNQTGTISTSITENVGIIREDGEVHYVVKIDPIVRAGNTFYYNKHAIVIDAEHGIARVYGMPYDNSPVLFEHPYNFKKLDKNLEIHKLCIKRCMAFIDANYITYMIRVLDEQMKEQEEIASEV